ncbi:hypothetical protein SCHPADRAFT_41280 [Schizopora paradoxa]|uniref:Uncharacterized protein n=1 Tax=Schizopora paradoxa TaxID=27342 RepID=A0A0H2S691_9AGAM|nr:hypothetical protein SCHPADRAFT_41280 [Schizopora paradoxa]
MNKDAMIWESLKDTLQSKDVSEWNKLRKEIQNDPSTWGPLKSNLIIEQDEEKGGREPLLSLKALWDKFKEAVKNTSWTWSTLKEALDKVLTQIGDGSLFEKLKVILEKYRPEIIVVFAAIGVLCFVPMAAIITLNIAGFAITGPVAGSIAAATQSAYGLVEAGSIFALTQSITMSPATIVVVTYGALIGTAVFAVAGALAYTAEEPLSFPWLDGESLQPSLKLFEVPVENVIAKGDE